ncbi:hypothetical protein Tco_1481198 [Tanacetum coccineum]
MVVAAGSMKVVGFGGDDAMVEVVTGRWGDEGDDDGFVMRRWREGGLPVGDSGGHRRNLAGGRKRRRKT